MKIIVDAMGGDNAPSEIVKGAVLAAKEFDVEMILTGRGEEILRCFESMGMSELPKGIEISHASEVIEMEDDPATAPRQKKDSSMSVGLRMLRDGEANAMVSAGSTGALLSGSTLIVKRIRGIRRAALAPFMPNTGTGTLIIDCGANLQCTPEYLLQFAYMGSYYVRSVIGISDPRVGLLNIGAEEQKGKELQKETYALLKKADKEGRINFVGNVEARDVALGGCDVIVCDGFTGNVMLKSMEGLGLFVISALKGMYKKNLKTKLAALIMKKDLMSFKKGFDVSEVGGTVLLGISKPVIKAHGSSNARAIRSAIYQAIKIVNAGVAEDIADNIEYMMLDKEQGE